ncbi:hypothetical protein [Photobacterium damselae]|uniref:hypothetical protein n=1 Tax=Photobacterium damselae TaxID=38293 RepID=UPI0030F49705
MYTTVVSLLFKIFVVGLVLITSDRVVISKAIKVVLSIHIVFFVFQWIMYFLGFNNFYVSYLNPYSKFHFSEFAFLPFRSTGLFDEPSLFGMTIILLSIALFFIGKRITKLIYFSLFSFSFPVMVVSLILTSYDLIKKNIIFKIIILALFPIACYLLYDFFMLREQSVQYSPLSLRTNHLFFLLNSKNLFTGSGLCNAYGVFDLALPKEELMQNYLSNFKDAGQIVYLIDRVGVIFFSIYLYFVYRNIGMKSFLFVVLFLGFSKTISISPIFIFMIFCTAFVEKDNVKE